MSTMAYEQFSSIDKIEINEINENIDIFWHDVSGMESFGEKKVLIKSISMIDEKNPTKQVFRGGENISLKIKMFSTENIEHLISGFIINDHLGNPIFGANTKICRIIF